MGKARIGTAWDWFMENVKELENGCWEWAGRRGNEGTPIFNPGGHVQTAASYAWEWKNNKLSPGGKHIRHSCGNSGCVNPEHSYYEVGDTRMMQYDPADRGVLIEGKFWDCLTTAESISDCWEWHGKYDHNGTPIFYLGDGHMTTALRYMWQLSHNKPLPEGSRITHTSSRCCANCVNPDHMFVGGRYYPVSAEFIEKHYPRPEPKTVSDILGR